MYPFTALIAVELAVLGLAGGDGRHAAGLRRRLHPDSGAAIRRVLVVAPALIAVRVITQAL